MVDFNKLLQQSREKSSSAATPTAAAAVVQQAPQPATNATVAPAAKPAAAPVESLDLGMDLGMDADVSTTPPTSGIQQVANTFKAAEQKPDSLGSTVEYPGLTMLQQSIYSLEEALKSAHPMMDSLLQTIHRSLGKDPQLIHLLKEEQCAILFRALQNKTQTKIVQETVKTASSGRSKRLKSIGIEDL